MSEPAPHSRATVFEALIVPHRSLSPRGMKILIGVMIAFSCVTVLRFWLIGAWPVAAFVVPEIGLAAFLLRLNARRARQSELVLLSADGLRIVRTDMRGRREEQTLTASWLTVALQDRPGRVPALFLSARGRQTEIG